MELIIGGAFQGKTAYASGLYPKIEWLDGSCCSLEQVLRCKGIDHFEIFIRRILKEEEDVSYLAGLLIEKNPDIVLISTEIGYGVVPVDAFDRMYRESVGRICTELAAFSKKVHRVVCGVGMVIKSV